MVLRSLHIFTILTLLFLYSQTANAQADSLSAASDTTYVFADSVRLSTTLPDSLISDTLTEKVVPKKKKQVVDEPVFYSAKDSMSIFVVDQTVLLWGSGKIEYQDIELTSEYIVSDLEKQEIIAKGALDTAGKYFGEPNFKKGSEVFDSDSMQYNIKTGKGIIYNVKSEQGEGYLHSQLTKRDDKGHVHMKGGKYTTCDADDPHFYMSLTKAIAIPNDKIVSSYAFMVVEDVPIPMLGIPFGFFPSTSKRGAGVIIPKYGEERNRGFYLRGGGWYQPLGEYLDVRLLGDMYTNGSWALHWGSDYKVRYKFSGGMKIDYAVNKDNSNNSFVGSEDFKWTWRHTQDAKANPTQNFSANVDFSSSNYDNFNEFNYDKVTRQQKASSISFSKSFPGTPFNLSLSANARQNQQDSTLTMDLPKGSFTATTIYPFRKEGGTGKYKWYENIGFSYTSEFQNHMHIKDTMLFEAETWNNLDYGFKHSIPVLINIKTDKIKMLTISPSLRYDGVMNSRYINKKVVQSNDERPEIVNDTIQKVTYAHAINPSISVGLTPKVTGMFLNSRPNPKVIAIRHVMQPRASFSYTPDMSKINPNYNDTIFYNDNGELRSQGYSLYEKSRYRSPSFAGESGSLGLGLSNNLEMKLRPKNDTVEDGKPQKVVLLRNLNISTGYNPFATSFKWSDVNVTTSTSLFKNKLSINLTSRFSPYDFTADTLSGGSIRYVKVEEFNFDNGKGLVRFTNLSISTSFQLKSKQKKEGASEKEGDNSGLSNNPDDLFQDPFETDEFNTSNFEDYVDFSVPWSLNVSYSYSINRQFRKQDQTISSVANFSGDFSLTPKWKLGFRSGYDFERKEVALTSFNIHRDLHCWEMRFSITPFGRRRNYSFYINAKAAILRDLKYDKRQSWYDNL